MGSFILIVTLGILGSILLVLSVVFFGMYIFAQKGTIKRMVITFAISIILIVFSFVFGLVKTIEHGEKKKKAKTELVQSAYSMTPEQIEILDEKDYEECDMDERIQIVNAATLILNAEEKEKYEPQIKEFYINYLIDLGMEEEDAIKQYAEAKKAIARLEYSLD